MLVLVLVSELLLLLGGVLLLGGALVLEGLLDVSVLVDDSEVVVQSVAGRMAQLVAHPKPLHFSWQGKFK